MQDESLTSRQWNVPPRGGGPTGGSARVARPVLQTVYSRPPVQPGRFIETPGMGRIGPRPTAYEASGRQAATGQNLLANAMASVIMRAMKANRLL